MTATRGARWFPFGVTAVFVAVTIPRLYFHELWRDETWVWVIALESANVRDLFAAIDRAGHGYLYPLLCFAATHVSTAPGAMQALHLFFAGAAVLAFARWAPFSRRARTAFVFGYFPLYEYAVLSRDYVVGLLLLWLACAAAKSRRPAPILGAALGLLCQTTVYGLLCALAVGAGWLVDRREHRAERPPIDRGDAVLGLVFAIGGAIAGIVQLMPAEGTTFAAAWRLHWDTAHARSTLAMPWRGVVPIPAAGLQFWNTNVLDTWPSLQAAAGIVTVVLALVMLWPNRVARTTFIVGGAGLLAFGYVKYAGFARHHGHWVLLIVAAIWLGGGTRAWSSTRRTVGTAIVTALAVIHVAVAGWASWIDLHHPFSNGVAIAVLLRDAGVDSLPLFGHRESQASTLALALGRPLFAPSRGIYTTHPDWGPDQRELTDVEVRCAAHALADREGGDIVMVMSRALPPWRELTLIGARVGAIEGSENFHAYRLHRDRLASSRAETACPDRAPEARRPGSRTCADSVHVQDSPA